MSSQSVSLPIDATDSPGVLREVRSLVRLAIPLSMAMAGQALMGVVDTAVVGRAGATAQGAVGLGNALFFAVASFGMGLMMGIEPLVSQAFGAGRAERARQLLWQGVWLAVAGGAALSAPFLLLSPALGWAGFEAELAREATGYVLWRLPGLVPLLCFIAARAYLQGAGRPLPLVVATIAANALNLGASILLVFGGAVLPEWAGPLREVPAMGAAGAGLTTTLCVFLQLLIAAAAIRGVSAEGFSPAMRRPVREDLVRAVRVGVPVALQMGAEVGVFGLVGMLAGRLGSESVAAHQVAITYASFTFCLAVGVGSAGSVRVGWAVGARDTAAARLSGQVAFGTVVAVMSACAVAFFLFPEALAAALSSERAVRELAVPLLGVTALLQISDGVQAVGAGVLRGAGDTRPAFWAMLLGHYGVGLPLAMGLGLSLGMGVLGFWWGLFAGLVVVAAILFARFWQLTSRPVQPLDPDLGS